MTTRNGRSVWQVLGLWCLVALAAPTTTRGDGSIAFNGTSSPSGGTSKVVNTTANVLNNIKQVTVCCWINPDGLGENNNGYVFVLDPEDDDPATAGFAIYHASTSNTLNITKYKGASGTSGVWSIPITDGTWNGICIRLDFNTDAAPTARVNFTGVTVTPITNPSGATELPNSGYCVGNRSDADRTWDGKIAYMQVFNRILSDAESVACLQAPGSITNGLRLWLPMTAYYDTSDLSGNGFDGTETACTTDITGPMLTNQPGVFYGMKVLGPGYYNVTQHIIPRLANSVNYPSGQLLGVGPASVIRANASTASLPQATRAVVITQDYDESNLMSQWQNGTYQHPEYFPAVLCPVVRDLTIAGYDPTGNNYADVGSDVNSVPWVQDIGKAPKYDLLRIRANGAEVRNVKLFACPGTAMVIWRDLNPLNGQVREFDREVNTISHVCFNRVFAGIDVRAVDQQVEHIEGTRWRDFGLKATSHHQLHDIHVYGGGDYGIWLVGDGNQLTDSYPESVSAGPLGVGIALYVQGSQNVIQSLRSHHCSTENVRFGGSSNVLVGFWLGDPTDPAEVNPTGINLGGQENQVSNGRIDLKPNATGIKITGGERHTIRDVTLGSYAVFTTTGIDADAMLNNCKINALIVGGGVGLDLLDGSTSRLGVGNDITIQAAHLGTTSELIDLPSTWDKSNRIVAGGMRLRGSITNIVHGSPVTTITAPSHGLQNGEKIAIGGAVGTNANSATGTYYTIAYIDTNTFGIPLNGSGTYTAGTGYIGEWITK